jgi:hypothetical protein
MAREDTFMKRKAFSAVLALALVVGLTGTAFAGTGSFTVPSDSTIQGKELAAGSYNATWNEAGEVTISNQNGIEVAKVQGQAVERADKAARTSVLKTTDESGKSQVKEVRFAGKKTVLVFETKIAQKQ